MFIQTTLSVLFCLSIAGAAPAMPNWLQRVVIIVGVVYCLAEAIVLLGECDRGAKQREADAKSDAVRYFDAGI